MILKVIYKFTALFLTFVLFANSINNIVIVTTFVINQDFIAETLCIQKENQKGCNGKCHLSNQLVQQNTDSNSTIPLPTEDNTRLDVFVLNRIINNNLEDSSSISIPQNIIFYKPKQPVSGFYSIEIPPPNLS